MSKLSNTRSVRSTYPGLLLLIDYGLSEKTIQGICHGLDQLFSVISTYVGVQRIPMFGLIVNGQHQSEIFIPLSLTYNNHMELQLALCKLQLLAQKWSIKSNGFNISSVSWQSALQLAYIEINSVIQNNTENQIGVEEFTTQYGVVSTIINILGLIMSDHVDHSWHMIRCDLQEILIDPHHQVNHDRFFIYTEPSRISTLTTNSSSLLLPIYQLKALNFIKQTNYCISLIFGMPLLVISSACHKYDIESIEKNEIAFDTLTEYLRQNELMLICCLHDCSSSSIMNQSFSGHFVLSVASEHSLILRSIASSELLLPLPNLTRQIIKHEQKHNDENLLKSLSNMNIEDEEYNPLYYEAPKK
ncbi:unnamed protein product [Rotaria sp. Silwood1]|nr:unnamed protein product [Rotaria sp. Silwood1]CAF3424709.1 unnamed protein product [Rotaria sp. Silwood1]